MGRKMGWGVRLLGRGARRFDLPVHLQASLASHRVWSLCSGIDSGRVGARRLNLPVHLQAGRRGAWSEAAGVSQPAEACGTAASASSCLARAQHVADHADARTCCCVLGLRRLAACLRAPRQRLRRRAAA